ncbi:serine hydrolase domain-containing protein [Caulobacter segnis]|uniref:serine hydrolase domain-containing protein n=1 Tax=Caulobacter segnis TaxID=88688 RepID=UPI001CC0BB48|nr:serine hydrolase domain-containing protein [Caulobacter segnis]UAL08630.1 beta-lactamase family protein [Caulobacter segnis]
MLLVTGLPAVALAADYKPVVCKSAVTYAGPPLHAPVAPPLLPEVPKAALDPETVARLEAGFLRAKAATQAPVITAAILVPGKGGWERTDSGDQPPLLFWASAGKSLVAIVVLQLVEAGKLKLEDPIGQYVAGVPNGDVVTIRDLLAHTGGLFSANEDLKARAERQAHTLDEDVKIIARHGAMSCPGERWRYSNTGYGLLGKVIETVDGRSWQDAVDARIVKPLGLKSLRMLADGDKAEDVARLVSAKEAPIAPAWAGAAGPAVGSAGDMARVWAALLGGQLLKQETVGAMFGKLYPMFDAGSFYGLGAMAVEVPGAEGSRSLWLGHLGGTPGASAVVAYSVKDGAIVAAALTGDGSAAAAANLLLGQVLAPH